MSSIHTQKKPAKLPQSQAPGFSMYGVKTLQTMPTMMLQHVSQIRGSQRVVHSLENTSQRNSLDLQPSCRDFAHKRVADGSNS